MDVKNNKFENLTANKIEELHQSLKLAKLKAEMSFDFELAKYNICSNEVSKYDANIRTKITQYIIKSTLEFKELTKKIEFSKELLENRNTINKKIQEYFTKTKIIKLTRRELTILFDKDTNDLKSILLSGKLIHEDKNDSMCDEYEFTFSKNSSFKLSSQELEHQIEGQIKECEKISKHIEESKNQWKDATTKLVSLLETIENEVHL